MTKINALRTELEILNTADTTFDLVDTKGRRVGYRVTFYRMVFDACSAAEAIESFGRSFECEPDYLGEWFEIQCVKTLDGKAYGSGYINRKFRSLDDAKRAAYDLTVAAGKRFAKAKNARPL